MYKSILVPIDLEDTTNAARALEVAVEELKSQSGQLYALTVLPDMGSPLVAAYFPLDSMQQALNKTQESLEAFVRPYTPDEITFKALVETGTPHEVIIEQGQKLDVDLIVMPGHNHPAIERWLVGSVTAKVIERSPVSVLVVRE